jgi:hypothetical protein
MTYTVPVPFDSAMGSMIPEKHLTAEDAEIAEKKNIEFENLYPVGTTLLKNWTFYDVIV